MQKKIEKCTSCGSNMEFCPETQDLYCDHCSKHTDFEKKTYIDKKEKLSIDEKLEKYEIVCNCPNCGSINEINKNAVSYMCTHCGTPIVLDDFIKNVNAVIPFKISRDLATKYYKKWLQKRIFAPRALKKFAKMGRIEGHYIPVWAFDCETLTDYSGIEVIKEQFYTTINGKQVIQTRNKYIPFKGRRNDDFRNQLASGNMSLTNYYLDKLLPFDFSILKVYAPEYLLGNFVDTYSIPIKNAYAYAQSQMRDYIRYQIVSSKVGMVQELNMDIKYSNEKKARFLVPVYKLMFKYKNKDYPVYINGNTGEVKGKSPISKIKVLLCVLLGIAVVGLIIWAASIS